MKLVLLDGKTIGEDIDLSALDHFGTLTVYPTTTPEETLDRIQNADIIITNKVVITQAMMEACPKLKLICIAATGMNNVDLEAAKQRDIEVKNVAEYSTRSVVQHTFAMLFYLLEKLSYYNRAVQSGNWSDSHLFTDVSKPFYEIHGKKWGIIGLGAIGKEVAKMAEAFGATINYHSTSGKNLINDYHHSSLEVLLEECDIVSIHAPLNEKTHNLIHAGNLSCLREGSILLNLGRGGIVNEADLAQTLDQREIYVGLDVLMSEPIAKENPLLHVRNKDQLLITPHIAWTSIEARKKLVEGIVNNIHEFVTKV